MIVSIEKRLFLYLSYYIKYSTEKELIIQDMRKFYNSQSVVFKNEQNYYDKLLNTTSMHIDFNNYMLDRTLRERILNLPNNKNGVNSTNSVNNANIDVSQLKKVLLANTKHLHMKDAIFIIPDNYRQKYYYSNWLNQQICINGCIQMCNYCHHCRCKCSCIKYKYLIYILSGDLKYINQ